MARKRGDSAPLHIGLRRHEQRLGPGKVGLDGRRQEDIMMHSASLNQCCCQDNPDTLLRRRHEYCQHDCSRHMARGCQGLAAVPSWHLKIRQPHEEAFAELARRSPQMIVMDWQLCQYLTRALTLSGLSSQIWLDNDKHRALAGDPQEVSSNQLAGLFHGFGIP